MENTTFLLLMHYGFMHQRLMKIVRHYGMNKEMQDDIKVIVFMNQILVFVKK